MLDLAVLVSLAALFALGIAYVAGCDRLKGSRS